MEDTPDGSFSRNGMLAMNVKRILLLAFVFMLIVAFVYYWLPITKIPDGTTIDKILVLKSKHTLSAFSNGQLVANYKIAIGKNSEGDKEYEGDQRTPEGLYIIISKNLHSGYHKNLAVSYPNQQDIHQAKKLGRPTGGDIKLHGLKNGQGYIGKFQRWKDWTNGCIALTDEELDEIYDHTPIGTPIEIRK